LSILSKDYLLQVKQKQNPLPELIFLAAGFLETICAPLLQLALLVESYARHPGSDAPVPVGIKNG